MTDPERRWRSTLWPFGGRYADLDAWLNAGRDTVGSLWKLIIEQHSLHPETLKGLGAYSEYSNAPEIHPLVWMKSGVMERFRGRPKAFLAVMAPSTAGKDTILREIQATRPDLIDIIVTHTTKPPRPEDKPGETYHFVSDKQFEGLAQAGQFAEYVPQFGRRYGTSLEALHRSLEAPQPITVWRGEPIGWNRLQFELTRRFPNLPYASCFILPEISVNTLTGWILKKRGGELPVARIEKAIMEIYAGGAMDACIVNPYQADEGPTHATEALLSFFTTIQQEQQQG